MNIAYLTPYLSKNFMETYGKGKSFALSGSFKSLGIARAMMSAGHNVTIFSSGVTSCDTIVKAHTEFEDYPEGRLRIEYCDIISKHKCAPINEMRAARLARRMSGQFDALVYYNISLEAALAIKAFKRKIKVIEYEDNIFNKAVAGDKNPFEFFKKRLYEFLRKRTDGVMSVCNGLMDFAPVSVLTPGIISEDVLSNIHFEKRKLDADTPVHIILTGGMHYSKGGDLLVKSMSFIKTPCIVTVYGNCELNESTKKLIAEVPDIHLFEFKGYMPHDELIKTLDKDADILINTTRSMHVGAQAAGFPFKMMEYASTGRPIVSSEIGKLDEDFNKHITYYYGENPADIAAAVEKVISTYDECSQKACELQKMVVKEYSIAGIGEKLSSFFKKVSK